MWSEPLTTDHFINAIGPHGRPTMITALVRQGDGSLVATVRCALTPQTHTGAFGEMRIIDKNGGPKQKLRALRLLVREAFARCADHGVWRMSTEAPDQLLEFTRQMTGTAGRWERVTENRTLITGDLARARSHTLENTDADGNMAEQPARDD